MAVKLGSGSTVSDINVTPMVDIMLVLLIIFMVITPMLQKNVSVDMARAHNPRVMADAEHEDAVVVTVTRDGRIYLKTDRVNVSDVTPKVKDLLANKLDKTVYVKSDARAKYGDVVEVVDGVRAAGVENLGLLTERIRQRPGAVAAAAPATP